MDLGTIRSLLRANLKVFNLKNLSKQNKLELHLIGKKIKKE
jgi:hypothetical protein